VEAEHKEHKLHTDKELRKKLKEKDALLSEYLNDLKRLKAEFENYKKRIDREHLDRVNSASMHLVKNMLPVLDDLQRAITSADEHEDTEKIVDGLRLVNNHFMKVLEDEGVKQVPAMGEIFDPRFHEAVMQVESDDAEDGQIIEVLREGYMIGDKVLRNTMVKVASNANPSKQKESE